MPSDAAYEQWERIINASLEQFALLWNEGNLRGAVESTYSPNVFLVKREGCVVGTEPVLEWYRRRYPDQEAMGTLEMGLLRCDVLNDFVASAVVRYNLSNSKGRATGWTYLVFAVRHGEAKIVQEVVVG